MMLRPDHESELQAVTSTDGRRVEVTVLRVYEKRRLEQVRDTVAALGETIQAYTGEADIRKPIREITDEAKRLIDSPVKQEALNPEGKES